MCVVSMVSDHYDDWFKKQYPDIFKPFPTIPPFDPNQGIPTYQTPITREEFEALKRDVEHMKDLIKRARIYDIENDEPDCEIAEKMERLRQIAELVGIDLDDTIEKATKQKS